MNINTKAKRILCYGDSNTWGDPPCKDEFRYSTDIRWTGILQNNLGEKFEIIEEGLCGRTIASDDPKEVGRNGKTYLTPCLLTHKPLNLVILMLGTNDLKERFNLTAEVIAKHLEELVNIIQKLDYKKEGPAPKILIISPALVKEKIITIDGMVGSEEKSKQLAKYYREVANRNGCDFLDISQYVESSNIDGAHLDKDAHAKIAEILTKRLNSYKD